MRQIVKAACGLVLGFATLGAAPGLAQTDAPVVVELYTSQGCSSCPPADEFLAGYADDPRVIVLALHVDYWDYIGWEDRFADPAFTARQKSYARAIGSRTIYTPQLIVGGTDRVEGHAPDTFAGYLAQHLAVAPPVQLTVTRQGNVLTIGATSDGALDQPARVQLVRYTPKETVAIERGENAGKTITYRNIVTSWETLGDWAGDAPLSLTVKVSGGNPAVVIVQRPGPGGILAAARVE